MSSVDVNAALAWAETCGGGCLPDGSGVEIQRGGSARRFFRLKLAEGPAVLVVSDGTKPENALYGPLARWLAGGGVSVPKVLAEQAENGWLLLEDIGETDLWSLRDKLWPERRRDYQAVLRALHELHKGVPKQTEALPVELMPAFDDKLYLWEQEYFMEHAIGGLMDWNLESARRGALKAELAELRERLLKLPTGLVHRDCQSQNIMMRNGVEPVFIDFQGLRQGTFFYDLGSLIHDPYVTLYRSQREELLRYYHGLTQPNSMSWKVFASFYHAAAAQRVMQALGAYGNLGLRQGKPAFLNHAGPAWFNLCDVARAPLMPVLSAIAREAAARWPERAKALGVELPIKKTAETPPEA